MADDLLFSFTQIKPQICILSSPLYRWLSFLVFDGFFGMDFLLYIFNLSWSSPSFPSIWKTSSIIPMHKMGKPLDSPASFQPISLISCFSKLFEHIILFHLLFFLESKSILFHRQAGFRPIRSTLDQILFFSKFISDGF